MATDMCAWVRAAGLYGPGLQAVGHSYGAMVAAHLAGAGLVTDTIVLLDPPVLPLEVMARLVHDAAERTYGDLDEAIAAVAAAEPGWTAGDVRAKAEALTSVPMAGHGNNHSSESMNPAKAKSSTQALPANNALFDIGIPLQIWISFT